MAASDAIIARMGLDTEGIAKGMREAAAKVGIGGKQVEQSINRVTQVAKKAAEEQRKAAQDLGSGVSGMTQTLLSAQGATDAFTQSATALADSLKLGLGALVAVEIGAKIIQKIQQVGQEAEALKQKIADALKPGAPTEFTSLEELRSQMQKTAEAASALSDRDSGGVGNFFSDMFEGMGAAWEGAKVELGLEKDGLGVGKGMRSEGANARRDREHIRLLERNEQLLDAAHKKEMNLADIEEKRLRFSEKAAALAEIQNKFGGMIDAAQKSDDGSKMIPALQRQKALAEEAANRQFEAQERALVSEQEILAIKKRGADTEVDIASARVMAARAELDAGGPEEKQKANALALEIAEHELKITERKTEELRAQLSLIEKVANAQVSPEEKARMLNEGEGENLRSRINDPRVGDDEKRTLAVELAKNEEQARALAKATREQGYQVQNSEIDATTGRGEAEQIESVRRKLEVARQKAGDLYAPGSGASEAEKQAANAAVNQLVKTYDDLIERREIIVDVVKAETEIMEAQLKHADSLAGKLQVQMRYEQQIRQAKKDGNDELAKQLQKQQQLALYAKGLENFKRTPQQRAADKEKQRAGKRDEDRYDREVEEVKRGLQKGVKYHGGRKGDIAEDIKNGTLGSKGAPETSEFKSALSGTEKKLDTIISYIGGGVTNQ